MINRAQYCLVVVVAVVLACNAELWRGWPAREFSPEAWRAVRPEERYVFFKDLHRSGRLQKATREEVRSLLGAPDYQDPQGRYFSYTLKYREEGEYTFNALYYLQVDFSEDGAVECYFVGAD